MYNDCNMEYLISDEHLELIQDLHGTFAFLVRQELNEKQNMERFSRFMQTAKTVSKYPFFVVDFYEDLAYVDRIISVEDCFLAIKSDGTIAVSSKDATDEELNIQRHSLHTILRKTMPKTQYV